MTDRAEHVERLLDYCEKRLGGLELRAERRTRVEELLAGLAEYLEAFGQRVSERASRGLSDLHRHELSELFADAVRAWRRADLAVFGRVRDVTARDETAAEAAMGDLLGTIGALDSWVAAQVTAAAGRPSGTPLPGLALRARWLCADLGLDADRGDDAEACVDAVRTVAAELGFSYTKPDNKEPRRGERRRLRDDALMKAFRTRGRDDMKVRMLLDRMSSRRTED